MSQIIFREHVHACIHKAERMYNVNLGRVTITFDLKGTDVGEASCKLHPNKGMIYFLRFNRRAIEQDWETMVHSTIPHEVAHLISFACPSLKSENHDRTWKMIAIALGDIERGKVTHDMVLAPVRRVQKTYIPMGAGLTA